MHPDLQVGAALRLVPDYHIPAHPNSVHQNCSFAPCLQADLERGHMHTCRDSSAPPAETDALRFVGPAKKSSQQCPRFTYLIVLFAIHYSLT